MIKGRLSRYALAPVLIGMASAASAGTLPSINDLNAVHAAQEMQMKAEQNNFNQFLQGLTDFLRREDASMAAAKYATATDPMSQLGGSGCADSGSSAMARLPAALPASGVSILAGGTAALPTSSVGQQSTLIANQSVWSVPGKPLPVFSPDTTDAATQAYIDALITPVQPTATTGGETSTPAQTMWKAHVNEMTAPISLAENSMQLVAGYNRAIILSGDELANIQKILSISGSGAPAQPAVWSSDNLMDYIVQGVYANANWQQWANSAPEAGVHRAIALMTALSLKQEQQRNELLARLAALSAAKTAMKNQELVNKLNADKVVTTDQSAR